MKTRKQSETAVGLTPIQAMAERAAYLWDAVSQYDELSLRLSQGKIAYGTTSSETAEGWRDAGWAEFWALSAAIMRSEPRTLADAAIQAVIAWIDFEAVPDGMPDERTSGRRQAKHVLAALGSIACHLARRCRNDLPPMFAAAFGETITRMQPHGPPLADLPTLRQEVAA